MNTNEKYMNNFLKWSKLSQLLPNISLYTEYSQIVSSQYYNLAKSIFSFLFKNQKQDGSIYDSNISSTLDFQYHQTNFSLSGIILYFVSGDDKYYSAAYNSLKYYIELPRGIKKTSWDFNNFPILLITFLISDNNKTDKIKVLLEDYIAEMHNYASMEKNQTYGNNFVTLRALNQLLRFNLLGDKEDLESARNLINMSLKWQFDDGIFYDYPRDLNYSKGIPPLAYHAKITLIILLFGIIDNDDHIIDKAILGLEALVKLTSYDGEAFYYGRTNNALYGYACGILAFRVASNYIVNKNLYSNLLGKFKQCENALLRFCSGNTAKDGHLYIVPNKLEYLRCGFDSYMYVSVYNAFTMAMFLLSAIIKINNSSQLKYDYSPEVHYLDKSGFFVKKSKFISTAFNLKGHNYYQQYLLDPRYTCCSPLFIKFNGHDILPSIPFSIPIPHRNESLSFVGELFRKLKTVASEYTNWSYFQIYNPLHAGFIPYLKRKNKLFIPIHGKTAVVSKAKDMTIIKVSGRSVSVTTRGLLSLLIFIMDFMKNRINIATPKLKDMAIVESGTYFERNIILHDYFIHFYDKIWGSDSGKVGFSFRTYADGENILKNNRVIYKNNEHGFVLLLDKGEVLNEQKELCSSKGKTIYWDLIKENTQFHDKERNFITLKHTLIPFDKKNDLEKSISIFYSKAREFENL